MYVQVAILFLALTDSYCNNTDGQHRMIPITREQVEYWNEIPLPIVKVDAAKIDVYFPCKFKSTSESGNNVQPSKDFKDVIEVHYACD